MLFVSAGRRIGQFDTSSLCLFGEEQAEPEHGSCHDHHQLESQPCMTFNHSSSSCCANSVYVFSRERVMEVAFLCAKLNPEPAALP
jgi:hypothetical protein